MKRKLWLITIGTFLIFVILAIVAALLLGLHGLNRWGLVAGLLVLGLVAAVLVFLLLRARAAGGAPDDAVDAALAAARARLRPIGKPGRLPAVLVVGPGGSAKTTVLSESGLEPELIAGETRRDGQPLPTAATNIWYAQGTLFVEAGGALLEQPARWLRLLRHVRPRHLAAALARRPQAPRTAVVCFPCDELVRAGAAQSAITGAQTLRTRLLEVCHQFGVRLPVYVLFTRADRFPHFTEFVRSLSHAEAQEVLGATLEAQPQVAAALHAEREAGRLSIAFQELLGSLALHRDELLARESDESLRASAYEFPRELRKARDTAIQFLVELTRPSHIGVSPLLRGFYFTGVRPIVVEDAAQAAAAPAPVRPTSSVDATSVFDARAMQAMAAQQQSTPRGTRRIPEWVFLRRLFPDVILADRAAMAVTAGGSRVDALRRAGLIAATLVGLVAAVGFVTSYLGNRALEQQALATASHVQTLDASAANALPSLDALRAVAARLRSYQVGKPPLHLRWGLSTAGAMLPDVRRIYFHDFDLLLWRGTRDSLLADLQALPAEPNATSAYGPTYDALKAHLVTTSHPEASTAAFLAPVLMRFWRSTAPGDTLQSTLAARQFAFFGAELPYGNPFQEAPDEAVIAHAQRFLQQFGDVQRLYASLVAEGNEHAPPVQFSRLAPGAAPAVQDEVIVPGAFTRPGWAYVQARLKDVDRLFQRETWVVGPAAVAPQDRIRLAAELRRSYLDDYVRHWQAYLAGASIGGLSGPTDAARTLSRLADNQSPLLQLLAVAARNTAVDTTVIAKAFQPVLTVVPAASANKLVSDASMPYLKAVGTLQGAVAQLAAASGPARSLASTQVGTASDQVNAAVLQIAGAFSVDGGASQTGDEVRRLLQTPVTRVNAFLQGLPAADLNGQGRQFCQRVRGVLAKYPFNASASAEASPAELAQLFQPGSSAFSSFYNAALKDVLVREGTEYAPKIDASPQPSPAFVTFFNRAMAISRALYNADGSGPEVTFALRPQTSADVPEVTVTIDGQTQTYTRTVAAAHTFVWDGTRAQQARITAQVRGTAETLQASGPWALFHLLQQAGWSNAGNGRYTLLWPLPQQPQDSLKAEISFAKGVPIFMRNYIGGLRCVSEVAR